MVAEDDERSIHLERPEDGDHRAANSQISSVSPIDGEYTMTLTRQDVLDAGFRGGTANQIAGVWRVNFSLQWAQQFVNLGGGSMIFDGYQGGFSVDGDLLTLTDQPTLAFTWKRAGKRLTLSLKDGSGADPVDALIWTLHPWELTGT